MASICLKKFRGGVDAQRKIKEKRMQEEEEDEENEAAAKRMSEREGSSWGIIFNFPQLPHRRLSNFPTK